MACVIKLPERLADDDDQIVQAVYQTTNVTDIIQQAICLPNYDLLIHVHLQMTASEFVLAVRVLNQVVGP